MLTMAVAAVMLGYGSARAASLADALATQDPQALEAAVRAIETAAPDTPTLPDSMFAAARACELTLHQPARALALDDRIVAAFPESGVAVTAKRRATALRAELGGDAGVHADDAATLSALIAAADELAPGEVVRRASALADDAWPGAPDASLWLAEWLRRRGQLDAARARYALTAERWPTSPHAAQARRGGAACAIDAKDWDAAEELTQRLPAIAAADREVRANMLAAITRGRWRGRAYLAAWIVVGALLISFAAALVRAARATGRRWPSPAPPLEVILLGPPALVLVGVSITAHRAIAPAVATIALGGLALAWLSGAALAQSPRRTRARSVAHVAGCMLGVIALAYIAFERDGLADLLLETVRFGPEA